MIFHAIQRHRCPKRWPVHSLSIARLPLQANSSFNLYLTSSGSTKSLSFIWRGLPDQVSLGYYDSEDDAARAYDAESLRIRGPGAHVNLPQTAGPARRGRGCCRRERSLPGRLPHAAAARRATAPAGGAIAQFRTLSRLQALQLANLQLAAACMLPYLPAAVGSGCLVAGAGR